MVLLVPGSLTIKKEHISRRTHSKRKIVSVPALLSVRAELTRQSNQIDSEPKDEIQEFEEILIVEEQKPDDFIETSEYTKTEVDEIEPDTECIEILDQKTTLNSPPTTSNRTISCNIPNIPKSSLLVVTANGNYVITSLESNVTKRSNEIKAPPPQVEQIIILNSNDLQFTDMEVDCEVNEQNEDDKG